MGCTYENNQFSKYEVKFISVDIMVKVVNDRSPLCIGIHVNTGNLTLYK